MDLDLPPVIAERLPRGPDPEISDGAESDDLREVVSRMESELTRLGDRLDSLAAEVTVSVSEAVSEQMRTVADELRHTVSQLGRLLVRDLGKLSRILAQHREAIVADLRPERDTSP